MTFQIVSRMAHRSAVSEVVFEQIDAFDCRGNHRFSSLSQSGK